MIDLAYMAGLFDGEGCVFLPNRTSKTIGVTIAMTDIEPLNFVNQFFPRRIAKYNKGAKHKSIYYWRVTARHEAVCFLLAILPFLRLKGSRALLAVEFYRLSGTMDGKQVSLCRNKMRKFNERGMIVAEAEKIIESKT